MGTMRYIVNDVSVAADFYVGSLGFDVVERFGPAIAILRRGDVDLWLAGPTSSAARPMPDARVQVTGGWNRLVITVEDLDATVDRLRHDGTPFRNDIVEGPGGRQILVEDPSDNVVEVFEPA